MNWYVIACAWMFATIVLAVPHPGAQPEPIVKVFGLRVPSSLLTVITLDLEDVSFETVLKEVAAKAGVTFNYNRSRIPIDQRLTVRMVDIRAIDALNHVMEKTSTELVLLQDGNLAVVNSSPSSNEQRQAMKSTLSGFVRDSSDGESLPNATITIQVGDFKTGTLANTDGYYAIPQIPEGRCAVAVSYIGYTVFQDSVLLRAGQDVRQDIELDSEAVALGEIVVEAEAAPVQQHELRQQPSVVALQIKSLKQMPAMGETDLLRGLQLLPGVQTASDYSSGLYVRGGGPDQTGILLDQMRLYNPSHAFGFFSTFNPDAIKDVTFYKGAYPAQYGGSLGAILDVQNRDGNRREFRTSGGVSLISSRLMSEGPLGKGSWMVAGRRTYIDPVLRLVRTHTDGLDGMGYYFYDLNAKFNTQLTANDNIMISAYGGDDHLDVAVSDSTNSVSFANRWGNRALMARWTHVFSPMLYGRMIALYSKYRSDIILDVFDTPISLRNRVRDLTFKGDLDFFASQNHTLRTGTDLTFFRFDYGWQFDQWMNNQIVKPYLLSIYVQDDWKMTPLTEVRFGTRGAYYGEGGRLSINPRFSLSHLLQEGWRLKIAGGGYQQYLQLVSSEGFSGGDVWISLDETAKPGHSWQMVTGLEWEPTGTYKYSVESYYTDLNNLVVIDEESAENDERSTSEDQFKTGGEGYATGLEFFAEKRRGHLSGWLGYTLGWTRRKFPEIDQGRSFPPKYDRRHDLSLTATYRLTNWSWTANFVYATGQAYTPAAARYTLRDPASGRPVNRILAARRNTGRMLPYHRLDLGMRRHAKFFGGDAEFYLQIFNFYNRRNEWFIEYDREDFNRDPAVVKMLPVIPTFGFDFRF